MDYKKKYEQAMLRMNKWVEGSEIIDPKEVAEFVFPELKESEDEEIRNYLIDFVRINDGVNLPPDYAKKALAWLKKQGEHAKFCDSIQVGDKVTRNKDGVLVNLSQLKRVAKKDEKQGKNNMGISEATKQKLEDNLNKALEKETPESWNEFLDEQGEQKPAEWSEDDQSNFNELSSFILEAYRAEDASGLITWLKSLKDRVQPQPKQEWSEEDIVAIDCAVEVLSKDLPSLAASIERLKSLRHQNTWKPSDEQMEILKELVEDSNQRCFYTILKSLYEQLKNLRDG